MTGDIPFYRSIHESFAAEISKRYTGSEKIEIILQRPFPNPISWSNAARKLIAFDVDLILTYGSPATHAVIQEKTNIPLVYAGFYEPSQTTVSVKNVTGCGFKVPLSSILRYFKRFKTINTIGIVYSSTEEDSVRQYETMQRLCSEQNIKTEKIDIRSRADLGKVKEIKADAVFLTGSSIAHYWLNEIITILDEKHIPAADIFPDETESGILMTLYQPTHSQGEMAADIVLQILHGKKPDEVASHIFRDTELVLNLIEAKHLDITIPIQLLIEATRVIE
jgi:putative ABC transport system substrate-binding protein